MMTTIRRITLCCALLSGLALPSFAQTSQSIGTYTYDASGNVESIGPDTAGLTSFYEYDSAGRLIRFRRKTAGGSTVLTETFEYDAYGNQTKQTTNGTVTSLPASTTTNRLTGAAYDASGNMIAYGAESYVFDPVGTMSTKSASWGSAFYVYTADDERIGVEGPDGSWRYMGRDFNGKVLREWSALNGTSTSWSWVEDYIYRDGQLAAAARPTAQGGVRHFHLDHLGSPRLITSSGTSLYAEHIYYPYGREITSPTQELDLGHDTPEPMKFTGHERDFAGSYTGPVLDYMHARYYNPQAGRFLSVDPVLPAAAMGRPQRWNRYAYVANNPMGSTDPTGREIILTACVADAKSAACKKQLAIAEQAFGAAWKFVQNNNGVLTLKAGVSPMLLGGRFGLSARAMAYMANSSDKFNLITDDRAVAMTKDHGGAFTVSTPGGGANIYIDPSRFPQGLKGDPDPNFSMSAGEAFVHESGHALEQYFPGIGAINAQYGLSQPAQGEAFSIFLQNNYRRTVLGLRKNDIRMFYEKAGDIYKEGTKLEDIWP